MVGDKVRTHRWSGTIAAGKEETICTVTMRNDVRGLYLAFDESEDISWPANEDCTILE